MSLNEKTAFRPGTKVKIQGYPQALAGANGINYNNLVGIVESSEKVGFGLNNLPVYVYKVSFVDAPLVRARRSSDGRLIRETISTPALNFFEECYLLEVVEHDSAQQA